MSTLVFAIHLMLVNVATGASLLAVWLDWRGRRCEFSWRLNRALAHAAWIGLIGGGLFGLVQAALIWSSAWSLALHRAGSRVGFGLVEYFFSLVLLVVYAFWLTRRPRITSGWHIVRVAVPLAAGTNLLYHFPALFGALRQLASSSGNDSDPLTSAEFRSLVFRPEMFSSAMHFLLASIALTSVLGLVLLGRDKTNAPVEPRWQLARRLAYVALWATLLQWIIGPLVFVTRSRFFQFQLTGGDIFLTGVWIQVLVMALILTALQVVLARRPLAGGLAVWVGIFMLVVILTMCIVERGLV